MGQEFGQGSGSVACGVSWAHLFLHSSDCWSELGRSKQHLLVHLAPWCSLSLHVANLNFSLLVGLGVVRLLAWRLTPQKQGEKKLKARLRTDTASLLSHFDDHK